MLSTECANLERGIREAKLDYKRKTEEHLDSNKGKQVLFSTLPIKGITSELWEDYLQGTTPVTLSWVG